MKCLGFFVCCCLGQIIKRMNIVVYKIQNVFCGTITNKNVCKYQGMANLLVKNVCRVALLVFKWNIHFWWRSMNLQYD